MLCYCQETNNAQSAPQHEGVHSRAACTNVQSPLCRSTRGEIVMEKEIIFYTEVRSTLVATHETKSYCADHIYSHIRRDIYRIKRTLWLQCSIQQRTASTKGTTVVQVHVSVLQQEECVCTRRARQAKKKYRALSAATTHCTRVADTQYRVFRHYRPPRSTRAKPTARRNSRW